MVLEWWNTTQGLAAALQVFLHTTPLPWPGGTPAGQKGEFKGSIGEDIWELDQHLPNWFLCRGTRQAQTEHSKVQRSRESCTILNATDGGQVSGSSLLPQWPLLQTARRTAHVQICRLRQQPIGQATSLCSHGTQLSSSSSSVQPSPERENGVEESPQEEEYKTRERATAAIEGKVERAEQLGSTKEPWFTGQFEQPWGLPVTQ